MSGRATTRTTPLIVSGLRAEVLWPHPPKIRALSSPDALALPLQHCTNLALRTELGRNNGCVDGTTALDYIDDHDYHYRERPRLRLPTIAWGRRPPPPRTSPHLPSALAAKKQLAHPTNNTNTPATSSRIATPIEATNRRASHAFAQPWARQARRAPWFEPADGRAEVERWLRGGTASIVWVLFRFEVDGLALLVTNTPPRHEEEDGIGLA